MCYIRPMGEVGLREMRQNASDLIRRAQAGERVTITVAGRPAAVLGPVSPRTWRRWDDLAKEPGGATTSLAARVALLEKYFAGPPARS